MICVASISCDTELRSFLMLSSSKPFMGRISFATSLQHPLPLPLANGIGMTKLPADASSQHDVELSQCCGTAGGEISWLITGRGFVGCGGGGL